MSAINVPVKKINYVSFDKEMCEETIYNRMHIHTDCGDGLSASISFSWREENAIPGQLLEFISSTGIDISLSNESES